MLQSLLGDDAETGEEKMKLSYRKFCEAQNHHKHFPLSLTQQVRRTKRVGVSKNLPGDTAGTDEGEKEMMRYVKFCPTQNHHTGCLLSLTQQGRRNKRVCVLKSFLENKKATGMG